MKTIFLNMVIEVNYRRSPFDWEINRYQGLDQILTAN